MLEVQTPVIQGVLGQILFSPLSHPLGVVDQIKPRAMALLVVQEVVAAMEELAVLAILQSLLHLKEAMVAMAVLLLATVVVAVVVGLAQ